MHTGYTKSWLFFFKHLFIHERHGGWGQRHRQREKQAPCREPDVGPDPRSPGSCSGPKAGVKPLSHPGTPLFLPSLKLSPPDSFPSAYK